MISDPPRLPIAQVGQPAEGGGFEGGFGDLWGTLYTITDPTYIHLFGTAASPRTFEEDDDEIELANVPGNGQLMDQPDQPEEQKECNGVEIHFRQSCLYLLHTAKARLAR